MFKCLSLFMANHHVLFYHVINILFRQNAVATLKQKICFFIAF